MGPPKDIVLKLKEFSDAKLFIETGTFRGWTSLWASKIFEKVKTIEFSEEIYKKTKSDLKDLLNVDFIFGDSRKELSKIIPEINTSSIFWLDAHWCSFGSYGENDQCPLLDEIDLIKTSKHQNIILIDDARLFTAPPPFPNSVQFYPSIADIILRLDPNIYHVIIYDDVLICLPLKYKDEFVVFMQQKISDDFAIQSKEADLLLKIKSVKRFLKKIILYRYWRKTMQK